MRAATPMVLLLLLLLCPACRWDYNIPGMVDAAKSLADLQAKGLIKQVSEALLPFTHCQ